MSNIFTESEFLRETHLERSVLLGWIEDQIIKPVKVYNNKNIFFRKHIDFISKISSLLGQGISLDEIRDCIVDNDIDLERFRNSQNREISLAEQLRDYSYSQLLEVAASQQIVGRTRMTKEQLFVYLTEPERREEIMSSVRQRTRNQNATETDPSIEVNSEPSETNVEIQNNSISVTGQGENGEVETRTYTYDQVRNELKTKDLIFIGKYLPILYFRKMTKRELIVAITEPERREEMIRIAGLKYERDRQRTSANSELEEVVIHNEEISIEQNVIEEHVSEMVNEETETTLNEEELNEIETVENEVESTVPTTVTTDVQENYSVPNAEVPYTVEELNRMNSKALAVLAGTLPNVKYHRRLNKEELLILILNPSRRDEMIAIGSARYDLYKGRIYGQRRRSLEGTQE